MVRVALQIQEETREKLVAMAGSERKIGERLDRLVHDAWLRESVTIESLAEEVERQGRLLASTHEIVSVWQVAAQASGIFRDVRLEISIDDDDAFCPICAAEQRDENFLTDRAYQCDVCGAIYGVSPGARLV